MFPRALQTPTSGQRGLLVLPGARGSLTVGRACAPPDGCTTPGEGLPCALRGWGWKSRPMKKMQPLV